MRKIIRKLEKIWDNGFGMNFNRKFSLIVFACWVYACMVLGIFNIIYYYFGIGIGITGLLLDNHNINNRRKEADAA